MAFFNLVYCLDFFTPTNLGLYLVGGGGWVGRITSKIFYVLKNVFFIIIFLNRFSFSGERFFFFFSTNKAKIELVD